MQKFVTSKQEPSTPLTDDEVCAPTDPAELRKVVQKHCHTLDTFLQNRPIARHTAAAFEATKELLESNGPPASSRKFILDSGCGTARSSMLLGEQYPDHTILGVDRSFVRLNRNADNEADDSDTSIRPFQAVSDNVVLVRAELTDFWRCCLNEKWNIDSTTYYIPIHIRRRIVSKSVSMPIPRFWLLVEKILLCDPTGRDI